MTQFRRWLTLHIGRSETGLNSIERGPWFLG